MTRLIILLTLAALTGCTSVQEALQDGAYISVEAYQQIQRPSDERNEGAWCPNRRGPQHGTLSPGQTIAWQPSGHWCQGPAADVRIGVTLPITDALEADLGVRHVSFVMEHDRGTEGAYAKVTWRPFR